MVSWSRRNPASEGCTSSRSSIICSQTVRVSLTSRAAHEDSSWARFVLEVIGPRRQKKSDVSHISLPSLALSGIPLSQCFTQPPTPQRREQGRLMDVEGCSGPTAINSSPARSSLSCWWNLCTAAARHRIQQGLRTNASSMFALLLCLQSGQHAGKKEKGSDTRRRPPALRWPCFCSDRRTEEVKRLEGLRFIQERVRSNCPHPLWRVLIDGRSAAAQVSNVWLTQTQFSLRRRAADG